MSGAARGAKRRKTRVVGGDAAARGGDDEVESGDCATNLLCALPLALQEHIASLLDHDSLFTSARVCKAWRDVVSSASPTVMRGMLKRIVEGNAHLLKRIDDGQALQKTRLEYFRMYSEATRRHRGSPDWTTPKERAAPLELLMLARDRVRGEEARDCHPMTREWSSRDVYKGLYRQSCYDCASLFASDEKIDSSMVHVHGVTRTTGGALRMRLCKACSQGYAKTTPAQRLATGAAAKDFFLLRAADLQPLPHGIDTNPVDPGWAPMRLYRKADVTEAALTRWGDRASWEKERHKRLVGKV